MKFHALRAAVTAVWVLAMLALPGLARAAEPSPSQDTLGASVQSQVFVNDDRTLTFRNLSTVPAVFTFTGAGGWMTDNPTVTLPAGATGHVAVTGDGEDNATIGVNVTSAGDVAPGTTRTALAFQARIAHERPFDPTPLIRGVLGGALALIVVALVLRRTKPWNLRLTRSGASGQGLAEYALILALIAVVAVIALLYLGKAVNHELSIVGSSIGTAS